MPSVPFRVIFGILFPVLLTGCGGTGPTFIAKNEPWRADEERACLAAGVVHDGPFIRTKLSLGGPSVCGAERPFEMAAADNGRVALSPVAYLRCPMIPQVNRGVGNSIGPAAQRIYGVPLVELKIAGSYACRPINHTSGEYLSEHGHANALDVSGFVLADGRRVGLDPARRPDGPTGGMDDYWPASSWASPMKKATMKLMTATALPKMMARL
jgi:hypothetical protein